MFEIKLDKQPSKFLEKCEKTIFDRVVEKLKYLKQNPIPHDAKRLTGYEEPLFRVRVGKYRVLYRINYEYRIVVIVKIDHREKIYER